MSGLYDYQWQKASKAFLVNHPLCQCPLCDEGRIRLRPSEVVDHHTPHKGDLELFWMESNWRALNKRCHDSYKRELEVSGRMRGSGKDGKPIDPNHHWNR